MKKIIALIIMIFTPTMLCADTLSIPNCVDECGPYSATHGPYRAENQLNRVPMRVATPSDSNTSSYDLRLDGMDLSQYSRCTGSFPRQEGTNICQTGINSSGLQFKLYGSTNLYNKSIIRFDFIRNRLADRIAAYKSIGQTSYDPWHINYMPSGIKVNVTCTRWIADTDASGNFISGTQRQVVDSDTIDGIAVMAHQNDSAYFEQTSYNSNEVIEFSDDYMNEMKSATVESPGYPMSFRGISGLMIRISSAFNAGTCTISSMDFLYPSYDSFSNNLRGPAQCEGIAHGSSGSSTGPVYAWKIVDNWTTCSQSGSTAIMRGVQTRNVACVKSDTDEIYAGNESEPDFPCDLASKPLTEQKCTVGLPGFFAVCSNDKTAIIYQDAMGNFLKRDDYPQGVTYDPRLYSLETCGNGQDCEASVNTYALYNTWGSFLSDSERSSCLIIDSPECVSILKKYNISHIEKFGPCIPK